MLVHWEILNVNLIGQMNSQVVFIKGLVNTFAIQICRLNTGYSYQCRRTSSTHEYLGRKIFQGGSTGELGGIFYALIMTMLMQTCIIALKSKVYAL